MRGDDDSLSERVLLAREAGVFGQGALLNRSLGGRKDDWEDGGDVERVEDDGRHPCTGGELGGDDLGLHPARP